MKIDYAKARVVKNLFKVNKRGCIRFTVDDLVDGTLNPSENYVINMPEKENSFEYNYLVSAKLPNDMNVDKDNEGEIDFDYTVQNNHVVAKYLSKHDTVNIKQTPDKFTITNKTTISCEDKVEYDAEPGYKYYAVTIYRVGDTPLLKLVKLPEDENILSKVLPLLEKLPANSIGEGVDFYSSYDVDHKIESTEHRQCNEIKEATYADSIASVDPEGEFTFLGSGTTHFNYKSSIMDLNAFVHPNDDAQGLTKMELKSGDTKIGTVLVTPFGGIVNIDIDKKYIDENPDKGAPEFKSTSTETKYYKIVTNDEKTILIKMEIGASASITYQVKNKEDELIMSGYYMEGIEDVDIVMACTNRIAGQSYKYYVDGNIIDYTVTKYEPDSTNTEMKKLQKVILETYLYEREKIGYHILNTRNTFTDKVIMYTFLGIPVIIG